MAETNPCNILSLADRMALLSLYFKQGLLPPPGVQQPTTPTGPKNLYDKVSPEGIILEQDDFFRFRAYSSTNTVAVSFFGRILREDGSIQPFNHTLTTTASATTYTVTPQAGKGILLGAAASVPVNSITQGFVSAVGEVGRTINGAFTPHTLLFSGQLDDLTPLTSVNPTPQVPTGRAEFYAFNDTSGRTVPYQKVITPNVGKRYRFTRCGFTYAASATVGTRTPRMFFRASGNSFQTVFWPVTITAGQTWGLESSVSGSSGTQGQNNAQPLNSSLFFYDPISVEIENGTAIVNDTLTAIFIRWEES